MCARRIIIPHPFNAIHPIYTHILHNVYKTNSLVSVFYFMIEHQNIIRLNKYISKKKKEKHNKQELVGDNIYSLQFVAKLHFD